MTEPNDPAFLTIETYPSGSKAISSGLTKREYFAGLAMQGFCSHSNWRIEEIPKHAVLMADALIAELNRAEDKKHV